LLSVFSDTYERAEKIVRVLDTNPYYEPYFLRFFEALRRAQEDLPSVEAGIVLRRMMNTRNLMIALQLVRTVHSKHPEWDRNGKLDLRPNDVLKYALRTEEALAKRKDGFSTTAFASGLVYDYLWQIAQVVCADPKKAAAVIDQVYAHGMKAGRIGMRLAEGLPDFSLKKYVFMGCMVHDVGKAV